jgi:putative transposase
MLDDLNDFMHCNRDAREFKRAVAVQMFIKGYKHREIGESLGVSSGFISKWTERYEQLGVQGLKLGYQGSVGYLEPEQRFCGHRLVKAQELLESRGTARIH